MLESGNAPDLKSAVTANAMAHQTEEYISAGMDGFVAKPIQLEALMRALSEFTTKDESASLDP